MNLYFLYNYSLNIETGAASASTLRTPPRPTPLPPYRTPLPLATPPLSLSSRASPLLVLLLVSQRRRHRTDVLTRIVVSTRGVGLFDGQKADYIYMLLVQWGLMLLVAFVMNLPVCVCVYMHACMYVYVVWGDEEGHVGGG